ncbi:Transmembrane osmosensor [Umbelopsis nana]
MIDHRLLTTNPVLLGSSLLLLIGWIIAFGGLCASQALVFSTSWWFIIFEFITMLFVFVVIITASIAQYRLVILTFLAISLSYVTGEISKYLHTNISTSAAITTGYIFIAIVQFLWIFVFGSTEDTRFGSVVDNLTIHAQSMPTGPATASAHTPMVQTNPYATTPYGPPQYNTSQTTLQHQQSIKHQSYVSNSNHSAPDVDSTVVVSPNAEYPIDVVALHAYESNPDDPNELSFAKGDVLQVHDKRGNWWQARKMDGSVGIVPSNYFAKD